MSRSMLICSRDAEFCLMIKHIFEGDGFEIEIAETIDEAVSYAEAGNISAVILDCQPDSSVALAICVELKSSEAARGLPIVGIAAPGCQNCYFDLLKVGVNEAFVRPIAPHWVHSCLHSMLPRQPVPVGSEFEDRCVISCGNIKILADEHRVQGADGKDIPLSPIEFKILRVMSRLPGQVFSREALIRAAWPDNINVEPRTVDVHIGRLRRLLSKETGKDHIRTVRSAGYSINNLAE